MPERSEWISAEAEQALAESMWRKIDAAVVSQRLKDYWIAGKLEVSKSTYANWKREKRIPRGDYLYRLADIVGVTVESFFSDSAPLRITRTEADLLDRAKRYTPVIDGLDVMDPVCRSALTRAIVDIAAPRQPEPAGYQREAPDQPVFGDELPLSSEDSAAI